VVKRELIMEYTYIDTIQKENIDIFYSEDDEGYIARLTEMPTLSAFWGTPRKAMAESERGVE